MRRMRRLRRAQDGRRLIVESAVLFDVPVLTGSPRRVEPWEIRRAEGRELAAYRRLRREAFVDDQHLFAGSDADDVDDDPRAIVLVAVAAADGGGRRRGPTGAARRRATSAGGRAAASSSTSASEERPASEPRLVRGGVRTVAEASGVLRFDATVQDRYAAMFRRLGWTDHGPTDVAGAPHRRMRWPIDRIRTLAERTKAPIADLLDPFGASWGNRARLLARRRRVRRRRRRTRCPAAT